MIIAITLLTSCLKLLFLPAYRSTDFEVHRNWLAVTHSLPIEKWYYEDTSEWTLDYPPFFAWFEYFLSYIAVLFDKDMLDINNINYSSDMTILFQRLSVIITDLVYVYGAYRICGALPKCWKKSVVLPILLLTNCGLIMVDHIHFQYNGMMYGIMLLSVAHMLEDKYEWSAFWFSFLLNMKHIYLYLAPIYFVYLLRHKCFREPFSLKAIFSGATIKNTLQLGAIVAGVFACSFLPFAKHFSQVLARLFPFKRGLCHAYWAPNVWAFYNVADKIGFVLATKFSIPIQTNVTASMTGGLVQEFSHSVLPSISPLTTILLTVIFILPVMTKLFFTKKNSLNFLRALVVCGLTFFLFGWHVHEKAILMAIIPLSVISIMEPMDAKVFLILSTVGHYSLLPLLFPQALIFVKGLLLLLYTMYAFYSLHKIHMVTFCKYSLPLLNVTESFYTFGLAGVFLYENLLHQALKLDRKWPFLPLMITSVYCSIGVFYCWARYYLYFIRIRDGKSNETKIKK